MKKKKKEEEKTSKINDSFIRESLKYDAHRGVCMKNKPSLCLFLTCFPPSGTRVALNVIMISGSQHFMSPLLIGASPGEVRCLLFKAPALPPLEAMIDIVIPMRGSVSRCSLFVIECSSVVKREKLRGGGRGGRCCLISALTDAQKACC